MTPTETFDVQPEKTRKPYAKPSLQVYGGVLELTQAHGTATTADGGTTVSGFVNKTN
jgi:hypothetical protein